MADPLPQGVPRRGNKAVRSSHVRVAAIFSRRCLTECLSRCTGHAGPRYHRRWPLYWCQSGSACPEFTSVDATSIAAGPRDRRHLAVVASTATLGSPRTRRGHRPASASIWTAQGRACITSVSRRTTSSVALAERGAEVGAARRDVRRVWSSPTSRPQDAACVPYIRDRVHPAFEIRAFFDHINAGAEVNTQIPETVNAFPPLPLSALTPPSDVTCVVDEVDVLVVGFGITGGCAAVSALAAAAGARVLVLSVLRPRAARRRWRAVTSISAGAPPSRHTGHADSADEDAQVPRRRISRTRARQDPGLLRRQRVEHFNWLEEARASVRAQLLPLGKAVIQPNTEGRMFTGSETVWPFKDRTVPAPRGSQGAGARRHRRGQHGDRPAAQAGGQTRRADPV